MNHSFIGGRKEIHDPGALIAFKRTRRDYKKDFSGALYVEVNQSKIEQRQHLFGTGSTQKQRLLPKKICLKTGDENFVF